jgi:hypothetical protein
VEEKKKPCLSAKLRENLADQHEERLNKKQTAEGVQRKRGRDSARKACDMLSD